MSPGGDTEDEQEEHQGQAVMMSGHISVRRKMKQLLRLSIHTRWQC